MWTVRPKQFRHADLANPVTRGFSAECGTYLLLTAPCPAGVPLIKVGTLDDPSIFGTPQMVIYTIDKPGSHHTPEGAATFARVPG